MTSSTYVALRDKATRFLGGPAGASGCCHVGKDSVIFKGRATEYMGNTNWTWYNLGV